ncbi:unnamed protein product [Ceratitis capitata]|uniref:(Mediterranean fruit fly) hypothetical protein n=1 Tax=Ceratitis capitata TaxID=7213 RepID=A0A811VC26_CERCA|nr:unnamed protein product [Ceratitis capitata]
MYLLSSNLTAGLWCSVLKLSPAQRSRILSNAEQKPNHTSSLLVYMHWFGRQSYENFINCFISHKTLVVWSPIKTCAHPPKVPQLSIKLYFQKADIVYAGGTNGQCIAQFPIKVVVLLSELSIMSIQAPLLRSRFEKLFGLKFDLREVKTIGANALVRKTQQQYTNSITETGDSDNRSDRDVDGDVAEPKISSFNHCYLQLLTIQNTIVVRSVADSVRSSSAYSSDSALRYSSGADDAAKCKHNSPVLSSTVDFPSYYNTLLDC